MKFEFNLEDILLDEETAPDLSLAEAVRAQVLTRITSEYRKRLFDKFDNMLLEAIQKHIDDAIKDHMPTIVNELLDKEIVPTSRYGERSGPTSFRKELINAIAGQMKYEPKNYSTDENAFTRAVKSVVEVQIKALQAEFTKQVDENFKRTALQSAVSMLSERLNLPKASR